MASRQPRSRSPIGNKRPEETNSTRNRGRDKGPSLQYQRRRSPERGASPARALRREEGPGSSEARPRHPDGQQSPSYHRRTQPRRRSGSRRRRSGRSLSVTASPRSSSLLREPRPAQPPSLSAARRTNARSHRHQRRSSSVDSERTHSIRYSSRHPKGLRGPRREPKNPLARVRPPARTSYQRDRHFREYSRPRHTSSQASRGSRLLEGHRSRSPSIDSRNSYQRCASRYSTSSCDQSPPQKTEITGREAEGDILKAGIQNFRTKTSFADESGPQLRERVGINRGWKRLRSPSVESSTLGEGLSQPEQDLPRTKVQRRLSRSPSPSPVVDSPPAFKIKSRAKQDKSVNFQADLVPSANSADSGSLEDSSAVDEMYNAQWQGGRGGSEQRHPSFGYPQNNRGGWQGYQG